MDHLYLHSSLGTLSVCRHWCAGGQERIMIMFYFVCNINFKFGPMHTNTLFFCTTIYFAFQAQSLFKQAAASLSFLPGNVSHSKQAAVVFIPAFLFSCCFSFTLFQEVRYILDPFLYLSSVYKAPVPYQ